MFRLPPAPAPMRRAVMTMASTTSGCHWGYHQRHRKMRVVEIGIGPLAINPPALAAQDALIQAASVKLCAAEPRPASDGSVRDNANCKLDRRTRKHQVTHRPCQLHMCQSRSFIIANWLRITKFCGAATSTRGLRTTAAAEQLMRGSMTDQRRPTLTTISCALMADTYAVLVPAQSQRVGWSHHAAAGNGPVIPISQ
jgi:hypothetical protein